MGPRPFGRGRKLASTPTVANTELQWGRDLSVAEGSMHSTSPPSTACFNGAATFRSRKDPNHGYGSAGPTKASMGPRPFGRGRDVPLTIDAVISELQWGRDLSVAEGGVGVMKAGTVAGASMGPRPFGRGRWVPE